MTNKEIGKKCKFFRCLVGYRQIDVADEIGYCKENISAFENGRNDNMHILLWYLHHGMSLDELRG